MEVIYLIALEITIILGLINFLSFNMVIIFSLIIISGIFIFNNRKNIFLLIVPFVFLLRVIFIFNHSIDIDEIKKFNVSYYEGRGKIEKIDNRYPLRNSYTYLSEYSEGEYEIIGKIKAIENKYENDYYMLEIIKLQKINSSELKEYFKEKSEKLLKNSSYELKRVYNAMILGEGYRIPKELRETFNYIGISHLIALSGFHISLVIIVFSKILSIKLPLKKRERNMVLLLFLTIYYLGIQHSPSLNRAYIMGSIYLLGKILNENTELIKSLTVSYVLSLIINPASINSISFQLSYLAVFILSGIYPYIQTKLYKGKSKLIRGIILTITVQLFLTPLVLDRFGVIQLLSFISNLILIPIGTTFITVAFLGLIFENFNIGYIMLPFINITFKIFKKVVEFFEKIPYMSVKLEKDIPFLTLGYIFLILIIFILKFRKDKNKNEKIYRRVKISQ